MNAMIDTLASLYNFLLSNPLNVLIPLAALGLVIHSFSRIIVSDTEILAKHPLRSAPARKSIKCGVRLTFNDGRSLRVPASYTCYREFLVILSRIKPELA